MEYASQKPSEQKKKYGQFFTPIEIAALMASYCDFEGNSVRVLDPGCGATILSCALVEKLTNSNKDLRRIDLVVYEADSLLIPTIETSLNYLREWLQSQRAEIDFNFQIRLEDFVLSNANGLTANGNLFAPSVETYDIIISNPPYFKLPINDKRVQAAKLIVNGHPNIYAIFMAISAKLLKEDGSLIFITPRSYASGSYFKKFREYFFNLIELEKVHLFVSRKDTFGRDKVLQETVIIQGKRKSQINCSGPIIISSSAGLKDLKAPTIKSFENKTILDRKSVEKILYLPTNDYEEAILEVFKNWDGNLGKYNIKISTGPVVAFRAHEYIHEHLENGSCQLAPLFWLHNVKKWTLEWPLSKPNKGQYIRIENPSRSILIPNKNYIFLRRFSSKDDESRLIAAPYFCNFIKSDLIGIENKVNYIYRPKGNLLRDEIVGLCALLNSDLFDNYFRIFNGNVNVSATEIRELPLPPLETIRQIGNSIILSNDYSIEAGNEIVNEYFGQSLTHEQS